MKPILIKYKFNIIFVLIVIFGFFIRLWQIQTTPPGLFGDEADTGYQAYSILNTGRDYFGNFLPVHFQSFGDWRVPLYIYLDTIFIKLFGLTEFAVRFPAVLLGTISIILAHLLAYKITKNKTIATLAALLLAISPWHIQFSRLGLEAIFLTVLFPLAMILFWKALENKKIIYFLLSGLLFGLTIYAYSTPKLFVPLIIPIIIFIWKRELFFQKKNLAIFLISIFILFIPFTFDILKGTGQARFLSISIFNNSEVAETVRFERQQGGQVSWLEKAIHNKVTVWSSDFIRNYFSAYSMDFLFLKGDSNPRHSVGGRGELYLFELPFLLLGLGYWLLEASKKNKTAQFVIAWIIIAPIPSALTNNGGNHAIRLFLMLPWLQIIIATGIFVLWENLRSKTQKIIFPIIFAILTITSVFLYLHQYFVHYAKTSGRWWNYGYHQMFEYINQNQNKYDRIYISSSWEPPIVYTLFYGQLNSRDVQEEISISPSGVGKYIFTSADLKEALRGNDGGRTLYVLSPAEIDAYKLTDKEEHLKIAKRIIAPDGSVAFILFTNVKNISQ